MFIESVHGLQATSISLNERFTMLASAASQHVIRQRRTNVGGFLNQNLNYNTEDLIDLIAKKLQQQARMQAVKQRLNMGNRLRRYGSENNLSTLRRSNSYNNLSQRLGFRHRGAWQQSNNNLSRSKSFGNLSQGSWQGRGFRRRGGRAPALRSLLRGGRLQFKWTFGRSGNRTKPHTQNVRRRLRGRGRGGTARNQANKKPVPTKEELDAQLDQYMASTKAALDKELDTYMKNVMDIE